MLKEKRLARILGVLKSSGAASISELSEAIGVSGSTVRRDLKALSKQGQVQITHGGAVLPHGHLAAFELDSTVAAEVAAVEKAAIGRVAAAMIKPGQTVLLDSSTTVLAAARNLVNHEMPITAITNSLEIATCLSQCRAIEVIAVGGRVRAGSPTLTGPPGLPFLDSLHADVALLGTHAISGSLLTETSLDVVAMKRALMSAARRVIVLADETKFQPPALFTICDIAEVDELITSSGASEEDIDIVRESGCTVHVANPGAQS